MFDVEIALSRVTEFEVWWKSTDGQRKPSPYRRDITTEEEARAKAARYNADLVHNCHHKYKFFVVRVRTTREAI